MATRRDLWAMAIVLASSIVAAREPAPIDVTTSDLEATYRADAAARYRGETLTVSGVVTRIGARFVVLGSVQCGFDESVPALSVGDAVHLRGTGGGYILGSPMFEHCTLANR